MTRSITRRVKEVATSANQVATEQLPALVEALRDPRGKSVLPVIAPVSTRGGDELADLAEAFNSMQSTLVDVAHEQVEVLRRGVSDIFVTMARRNRSLIDRQLAMLDEFEAEVDDPDVLANYYQLDHMATRMRRNSESLLVLANAEPKRRRVKATEIDDVVRAAIGEVEDYRRIEIEALESLQVRGNVVADVSHLLAELLDNATSFSPPDSLVRVGGRRAGDSYMLRIVDNGVGIGVERLRELNELLREPPIVGLSVEPTLGMSVVSLLANRHGISVTLSQGNPGTTVDVLLPSSLFGPIDVPIGGATPCRRPGRRAARSPPRHRAVLADTERFVEAGATPSWTNLDLSTLRAESPEPAVTAAPMPAAPSIYDIEFEPTPEPADTWPHRHPPRRHLAPIDAPFGAPTAPHREHDGAARLRRPTPAPVHWPPVAPRAAEFDRPLAPPHHRRRPQPPAGRARRRPPGAHPRAGRPAADRPIAAHPQPEPRARRWRRPPRLVRRPAASRPSNPVTATSSPSALQAALAAFDSRRNGDVRTLPSRPRSEGFGPRLPTTPPSVSQSRLDPDALRERLRAFQTEFRTGTAGGADTNQHLTQC